MITDHSNDRLDEIKSFATTHDLNERFQKTFARLERHSQEGNEIKLYIDLPQPIGFPAF